MRIPLDRLLLKPNVVAGANYLVVAAFALRYRSSTEDLDPALIREEDGGLYRILDGRHRYTAIGHFRDDPELLMRAAAYIRGQLF